MSYKDETIPLISVQNVGKMYNLYDQPQDRLKHLLFWRLGKTYGREFWALRNVTFEVMPGEAVGIVGRNGSGKSTLMQMIAGVLNPSEGSVAVRGRISALLELGSGFNHEYTGRENIYLSGAILGMNRDEMRARMDDIIAFADIGEFIDQPVKTYSSGMFARLAFSVAISVEPDLLIVDEILSVGDYGFQQKCVARMRRMRDNGLTLLFVSHSVDAIKSTCNRGLFLHNGETVYWGAAEDAVNLYLSSVRESANRELLQGKAELETRSSFESNSAVKLRYGTGYVQLNKVLVKDKTGAESLAFDFGDPITLEVGYTAFVDANNLSVSFLVRDNTGIDLAGTTTFDEKIKIPSLKKGQSGNVCIRFQNVFRPGNYGISVAINQLSQPDYSDNLLFDQVDSAATFLSIQNIHRPVHYKFFLPFKIDTTSVVIEAPEDESS